MLIAAVVGRTKFLRVGMQTGCAPPPHLFFPTVFVSVFVLFPAARGRFFFCEGFGGARGRRGNIHHIDSYIRLA